ncbi:MAG: extracellular solute-binding protein, partial [Bacteroidota bacterium]
MKTLRGITWDHSRALPPLVAVGQRYEELNPGIQIKWDKRTLHEFGHKAIDELTDLYDLIVIDHPWAGFCFDRDLVVDLRSRIKAETYQVLSQAFVGSAFQSYLYKEKLLAIPIDTATPVPSWRPDLLENNNIKLPATWHEVTALADRKLAIMPGFTADLFLNWLMLLHSLDARPFLSKTSIAHEAAAKKAMHLLKRLAEPMPEEIFDWNPIRVAEIMTQADKFAYCPFAYSYSNYTRLSFSSKPLKYGELVMLNDRPLRSILGGTGLAISKKCKNKDHALNFSLYCCSSIVQKGIYTYAGGQPAHL